MKMTTFILIAFERWGGLRPEWKIDPQGRKWKPLFHGLWVRSKT